MNAKFTLLTIVASTIITWETTAQTLLVERRPVKTEESSEVESWTAKFDQDVSYCQNMYGDFIKELAKTKVEKRGKNVLVAVKTQFPELSSLRIDQRAIFTPESAGTSVSFTFSPGYDVHFSTDIYKNEFARAETFVKNYVQYHYKKYYNDLISGLQSKMKSIQSDIESNGKKIDQLLAGKEFAFTLYDYSEPNLDKAVHWVINESANYTGTDEVRKFGVDQFGLNRSIISYHNALQRLFL